MNVTQDLSLLSLITTHSSPPAQFIMVLLALLSMISWYWIFRKIFQLRYARKTTLRFEREFWSGSDLNALFQSASSARFQTGNLERIFEAGYREFTKLRAKNHDHGTIIDGSRRAMKAAFQRELDGMEAHLSFLATVGSVSPYIGLLGTVWGIMNAFRGLANVSSATLSQVAPGIAEALIATAIGLFAAIPAVVAYNRFASDIDRLGNRFESFIEEFSNILQRNLH